ncbi:MAG: S41 family peptidase [Bacteroidales bacterium]|nr:S41 family peptidase [Bacteroidales bacterium]
MLCINKQTWAQNEDNYILQQQKMDRFLQYLKFFYVDPVDFNKIVEKGTIEMLKKLDPHSIYIPKAEVTRTNEPLQGNFEGIGVQFQIMKDTIVVVQPVKGGPSEKVGIIAGDKIIQIDDSSAVGSICTNAWVYTKLRGAKGTKVVLHVKRGKEPKPLIFTIIRDKIPIHCIESYFMVDKEVGYIQLDRFSQTTKDEFEKALRELKIQGMKHLIFDLRGNSGGFLSAAIDIAEQFIKSNQLVVYTLNNQTQNKMTYNTKGKNNFDKGKLVIMIDEYSASASEIVSGAVQDWDRGIIVGRRSFGKGLVQSPVMFPDSSVIRLTTSRYYIPSGRSIQKPYEKIEDYSKDLINRYNSGELTNADSIHFPDSLKYYTNNKRIVYGGGGIMPDIFIPMDTIKVSNYYWKLFRQNIFNQFVINYLEQEKQNLLKTYPDFETFYNSFEISPYLLEKFYHFAENEGVKDTITFNFSDYLTGFVKTYTDSLNKIYTHPNELTENENLQQMLHSYIQQELDTYKKRQDNFDTEKYIKRQIRTLIARSLYESNKSAKIWLEDDTTFLKAYEIIKDNSLFKKLKISY